MLPVHFVHPLAAGDPAATGWPGAPTRRGCRGRRDRPACQRSSRLRPAVPLKHRANRELTPTSQTARHIPGSVELAPGLGWRAWRRLRSHRAGGWQSLPRPELNLAACGRRLEGVVPARPLVANQLVSGSTDNPPARREAVHRRNWPSQIVRVRHDTAMPSASAPPSRGQRLVLAMKLPLQFLDPPAVLARFHSTGRPRLSEAGDRILLPGRPDPPDRPCSRQQALRVHPLLP